MPRRGRIPIRIPTPDPVYGSVMVHRFINCILRKGKKSTSQSIVYGAMEIMREKSGDDPVKVLEKAMENAKPVMEVKSRRVGGSTYQVPVEVRPRRRESLALRWLIGHAHARGEKTMRERLAGELLDAANERGATIKKKEDVHKMAEANRAFAHYRW
jgi:small subunit ribosomal protein S7